MSFEFTEIISGGARYATKNNIKLTIFPVEWEKYGKCARFKRSIDIINACEAVIALWDGVSAGTRHSLDLAREQHKKMFCSTLM